MRRPMADPPPPARSLIFSYLMGQVFAACLLVQVLIGHFLWSVYVAEPSWAAVLVDIGWVCV